MLVLPPCLGSSSCKVDPTRSICLLQIQPKNTAAKSTHNGWRPAFTVEGTLDAVGTTASPIVFTSVNDNTVGGTTGSGNPAAGNWEGIEVRSGPGINTSADLLVALGPASSCGSAGLVDPH